MKPFIWPKPRTTREDTLNRIQVTREEEGLTGIIQGENASAEEERLYEGFLNADIEPEEGEFNEDAMYEIESKKGNLSIKEMNIK